MSIRPCTKINVWINVQVPRAAQHHRWWGGGGSVSPCFTRRTRRELSSGFSNTIWGLYLNDLNATPKQVEVSHLFIYHYFCCQLLFLWIILEWNAAKKDERFYWQNLWIYWAHISQGIRITVKWGLSSKITPETCNFQQQAHSSHSVLGLHVRFFSDITNDFDHDHHRWVV